MWCFFVRASDFARLSRVARLCFRHRPCRAVIGSPRTVRPTFVARTARLSNATANSWNQGLCAIWSTNESGAYSPIACLTTWKIVPCPHRCCPDEPARPEVAVVTLRVNHASASVPAGGTNTTGAVSFFPRHLGTHRAELASGWSWVPALDPGTADADRRAANHRRWPVTEQAVPPACVTRQPALRAHPGSGAACSCVEPGPHPAAVRPDSIDHPASAVLRSIRLGPPAASPNRSLVRLTATLRQRRTRLPSHRCPARRPPGASPSGG